MKITDCRAIPLNLEMTLDAGATSRRTNLSCVLVRLETDTGLVGTGFTAITEEEVVAAAIDQVAAPAVIGMDPMAHERIWEKLYWLLAPRGQSGYAAHAIAAIDLAVWDLKALARPAAVAAARRQPRRVPTYATFGFGFFDQEQLVAAAVDWAGRGFSRLKMTVGNHGLQRRDEPRPLSKVIAEDEKRVRAVREAVGPDVEICIDANCSLDAYPCGPSRAAARGRRPRLLRGADHAERRPRRWPTCAGARGCRSRRARTKDSPRGSRDFFTAGSLDIAQPNVAITGGLTQCLRIAGLAQAFNVAIANGGAWPFHNMHLHAGLAHGGFVEYHRGAVLLYEQIYRNLPVAKDGWIELPQGPGFGLEPDWDRIGELAKRPLSRGTGKA